MHLRIKGHGVYNYIQMFHQENVNRQGDEENVK